MEGATKVTVEDTHEERLNDYFNSICFGFTQVGEVAIKQLCWPVKGRMDPTMDLAMAHDETKAGAHLIPKPDMIPHFD